MVLASDGERSPVIALGCGELPPATRRRDGCDAGHVRRRFSMTTLDCAETATPLDDAELLVPDNVRHEHVRVGEALLGLGGWRALRIGEGRPGVGRGNSIVSSCVFFVLPASSSAGL